MSATPSISGHRSRRPPPASGMEKLLTGTPAAWPFQSVAAACEPCSPAVPIHGRVASWLLFRECTTRGANLGARINIPTVKPDSLPNWGMGLASTFPFVMGANVFFFVWTGRIEQWLLLANIPVRCNGGEKYTWEDDKLTKQIRSPTLFFVS